MNETFPTIVVVGGAVCIGVAVPRGLATPTLAVARVRVPCNSNNMSNNNNNSNNMSNNNNNNNNNNMSNNMSNNNNNSNNMNMSVSINKASVGTAHSASTYKLLLMHQVLYDWNQHLHLKKH